MSVLRPQLVLERVTDITPELLAGRGLRGLLLDLDNTLVEYGSFDEAHEVQAWAAELMDAGIRLAVLSNAKRERVKFWTGQLQCEGVGLASKPNPWAFRRAAQRLGLPPVQVGMVGDQVFTDVLGGNLAGLYTILVHPLAGNALPHTKLARRVERAVLRRYGVHGWYEK